MRRYIVPLFLLFVVSVALTGVAQAIVLVSVDPLTPHPPPAGFAYPPSDKTVTVTVVDQRLDKSFLAHGLAPYGTLQFYLCYATEKNEDLAKFMETAAREAVKTLGMKAGDGARLEIAVKDFRIDLYRLSDYNPTACMGYGLLEVTLTGPTGAEIRKADLTIGYYDTQRAGMKEVTAHALSRIYTLAAWQATAQTLTDAFGIAPSPEALRALMQKLDVEPDDGLAREMLFWLGLSGRSSDAVKTKLHDLFRKSKIQRVFQTASEAMGLLGITDAREEIRDILVKKKEIGDWNFEDNENVWYLIHALALMGETDLARYRPTWEIPMPMKIDDLIRFHEKGELPTPSAEEQELLVKAKIKIEKKRR